MVAKEGAYHCQCVALRIVKPRNEQQTKLSLNGFVVCSFIVYCICLQSMEAINFAAGLYSSTLLHSTSCVHVPDVLLYNNCIYRGYWGTGKG